MINYVNFGIFVLVMVAVICAALFWMDKHPVHRSRDGRILPDSPWPPPPPPPWKYCGYCGAELVQKVVLLGYDRETGERKTKPIMQCPHYAEGKNHDSLEYFHEQTKTYSVWPEPNPPSKE